MVKTLFVYWKLPKVAKCLVTSTFNIVFSLVILFLSLGQVHILLIRKNHYNWKNVYGLTTHANIQIIFLRISTHFTVIYIKHSLKIGYKFFKSRIYLKIPFLI